MEDTLITVEDIRKLLEFKPTETLVTSFYLGVDPNRTPPSKFTTLARSMLQEKYESLEKGGLSESVLRKVKEDFKRIEDFVVNHFTLKGRVRGLVIIADTARDFFQIYRIAQPVKPQIVVDPDPYIRPLMAILDEYHRLMLVLIDQHEARLLEMYMGEVVEHEAYHSDVRGKIKEGGWYGLEERRIERSIKNKLIHHYKRVADAILKHFRMGHFEYLFVGIKAEDYSLFLPLLHSYLQPKVKGRLDLSPKDAINTIIEVALKEEKKIETEEDNAILEHLLTTVEKEGLAVKGINEVLRSIPLGACQVLVVDEEYRVPGYVCEDCAYLAVEEGLCPFCKKETLPVEDVIEEAMEEVLLQRGEIKYITTDAPRLTEIFRIGAFLRYKI
jgi:peptide chain release factor subunit 1